MSHTSHVKIRGHGAQRVVKVDAMSALPLTEELRNRLRAARAYRGLSQKTVGHALGFSAMTIARMEDGFREDARPEIKWMELREIARICELPIEFFTGDFGRLAEPSPRSDEAETIQQLETAERNHLARQHEQRQSGHPEQPQPEPRPRRGSS